MAKSLGDSGFLLKRVSETIHNEVKKQKQGFLSMLLGTLGASLLGSMFSVKGIYRAGNERGRELVMYDFLELVMYLKRIFNSALSIK